METETPTPLHLTYGRPLASPAQMEAPPTLLVQTVTSIYTIKAGGNFFFIREAEMTTICNMKAVWEEASLIHVFCKVISSYIHTPVSSKLLSSDLLSKS